MKERIFPTVAMLVAAIVSVGLVSCGDDDNDNEDVTPLYPVDNNEGNHSGESESEDIVQIIAQNVSASITYSTYFWHISISTTLHSKLPQKNIVYGVEFGYGKYDSWFNTLGKGNTYHYNSGAEGSGNLYTLEMSIFDGTDGTYANESFYARQYVDILEKQQSGTLNTDQKNLLAILNKSLPPKETSAKRTFIGRLYVDIDSKRYYIKNFTGNNY